MHQSGTHWLKYMLANAIARRYAIAPPQYNHANDIIGGPHDPIVHAGIPRLVASHSMPHPLLHTALGRVLSLPPYVLLVRDIRDALVSNYIKWRARYAVSFDTYLDGDPSGRRYNSDLWWAFRFLNGWGRFSARHPEQVLVVHYETLTRQTESELARIAAFWQLDLDDAALAHGVAVSTKAHMAAHDDPARPPGAVRDDDGAVPRFSSAARDAFSARCATHLQSAFGYDYRDWSAWPEASAP